MKKLFYIVLLLTSLSARAQLDLSFHALPLATQIFAPVPLRGIAPAQAAAAVTPKAIVQTAPSLATPSASPAPVLLTSPKLITWAAIKIQGVDARKQIVENTPAPAVSALTSIAAPQLKPDTPQITAITVIPPDEFKMIHALLLMEFQKKYDVALSLFIDLLQSAKFKTQAMYHYAEISYLFGLESEYRDKMLQVLKSGEVRKKAVESLVKNASALKPLDVEVINPLLSEAGVSAQTSSAYLIKRAQYFLARADLALAEQSLLPISAQSKDYNQARLLLAHVNYRQGDLNRAVKNLEDSLPTLDSGKSNPIRNLSYLTLARLYFQKGNYKASYAAYLKIDKSSPLWLQSTTEQALTQIMAKDYVGAAGNMFSLHTDYFKKAYAPESYVIRAVGYLNLCQFGDAVSVVSDLQGRYTKVLEQVQAYKSAHPQSADYYALIRELFANPDQNEIKAMPRSFILELARQPGFIAIQKQINAEEDELAKFSGVTAALATKAQVLSQTLSQTQAELQSNKTKKVNVSQIPFSERKILALEYELKLLREGREKIEKMRALAATRVQTEKARLKIAAGEVLKTQFAAATEKLGQILEQKDVLAYEIYSGAGEHLRYQMAGGETKERLPSNALTPEEKQSYKWKFKGEVWEDEIGHYRSSLVNVCAKENEHVAKNTGGK